MRSMYERGEYLEKNPTWHEEDAPWKANHIFNMIEKNGAPHQTICEVGCGTGDILFNLAVRFPDSTLSGFDISPQAIDRAQSKEHGAAQVKFFLEDPLSGSKSKFDLALAIDVMEHVDDYLGFLRGIKDLAAYKIFHIPLDLSVQSIFRKKPVLNMRKDVGHIHYFFKDIALAALKDCGYELLDFHYTASRLELPRQAFSSRIAALPRRVIYAMNRDFAVRTLGGYSLLVLAR